MRNIRGRLDRLERELSPVAGYCPDCPPIALVTEDADSNLIDGAHPEPCRNCGGRRDSRIRFITVVRPRALNAEADDGS